MAESVFPLAASPLDLKPVVLCALLAVRLFALATDLDVLRARPPIDHLDLGQLLRRVLLVQRGVAGDVPRRGPVAAALRGQYPPTVAGTSRYPRAAADLFAVE